VSKEYVALVEGRMSLMEGRVDLPIARDKDSSVRVKMTGNPDGLPSLTTFAVLRLFPHHTLVRAFPLTGRQHQIRVHLASLGHPVAGDLLYKNEKLFLAYHETGGTEGKMPGRHFLHAALIEFIHPATGNPLRIQSPLPDDFLSMLAGIE
jgi:23S rRNA pseudouridine1911/1915/1917 synthase